MNDGQAERFFNGMFFQSGENFGKSGFDRTVGQKKKGTKAKADWPQENFKQEIQNQINGKQQVVKGDGGSGGQGIHGLHQIVAGDTIRKIAKFQKGIE